MTSHVGDGLIELLEKRGPVVNMRVMWSDTIFTASPEHIKTILATDFENYVKGEDPNFSFGATWSTTIDCPSMVRQTLHLQHGVCFRDRSFQFRWWVCGPIKLYVHHR